MRTQTLKIRSMQTTSTINTAIAFIAAIVVFTFFTPNRLFIDPRNLASMAKLTPDLGLVVLGVGILMIAGEFDLSISSIVPLCSFVFVQYLMAGMHPLLALVLIFPVGLIAGLLNGLLVSKTGLPSFIITLSTMLFWKGFLFGVSKMMPISINRYLREYPGFQKVLTSQIGPVPVQFIWLVGIAIVLGIFLRKNKFGNWIYATGSNPQAARAMGIKIGLVKTSLYMLIGLLCAFSSVMQATRLGSFAATQAVGYEFKAVTAVVVGGVSLRGGVGSMWGIFLGLLIVKTLETGLILMRVPVFGVDAFIGVALIIFVIINEYLNRRSTQ